jgi:hypothetical protein
MNDILEWSNSKETVKKNLRKDEVDTALETLGIWIAVSKANDKRRPE